MINLLYNCVGFHGLSLDLTCAARGSPRDLCAVNSFVVIIIIIIITIIMGLVAFQLLSTD